MKRGAEPLCRFRPPFRVTLLPPDHLGRRSRRIAARYPRRVRGTGGDGQESTVSAVADQSSASASTGSVVDPTVL